MPARLPYQGETPLLHTLIAAAPHTGWLAYHALPATVRAGRMITPYLGARGFPDLILVHPRGGIVVKELKGEGAYPDRDQRKWLDYFTRAADVGVDVGVWRPRDLDDALALLGGSGSWRP